MDINEIIPAGVTLQKYADDILAFTETPCSLPQDNVNAIDNWCSANRMSLNTKNCKIRHNLNPQPLIHLQVQMLEQVSSFKYLGIGLKIEL